MLIVWILLGAGCGFILTSIIGATLNVDPIEVGGIGAGIGGLVGFVAGVIFDVRYRVLTGRALKEAEKRLDRLENSYRLEQLERDLGTSPSSPTSKSLALSQQNIEQIQPYLNRIFDEQQEIKARLQKLEAYLNIESETSIATEKSKVKDTLVLEGPFLKTILPSEATGTSEQPLPSIKISASDAPKTPEIPVKPVEDIATEQVAEETQSAASSTTDPITTSQERIVKPSRPNLFIKILRLIIAFFSEGNSLARIGALLLLIGLGFLIQYAARQSLQLGILTAALTGVALIGFGWALRHSRRVYSLILQGGGIGVFYLSLFAGLRLLPPAIAFSLLILLGILAATLAVVQNSPSLAVLATLGGFLSPVLITLNTDLQVLLFSYYLVLNIGIAIIAWFKAWRWLNLIGFFFTFAIGATWGGLNYKPELFYSTEPFLIAFTLLYIAIAILYASRQPPQLKGLVDGMVVFGLPVIAFSLQAALLQGDRSSITLSSSISAAFYLALAGLLSWLGSKSMRLLSEAFLAIGLAFVTITIPLALGASWASTGWALEGVGLLWVGLRQNSLWMRLSGILIQLTAVAAIWWGVDVLTGQAYSNQILAFGAAILALSGIISAYLLYSAREQANNKPRFLAFKWETKLSPFFLGYGLVWWLIAGAQHIFDQQIYPEAYKLQIFLGFFAITTLACLLFSSKLSWSTLRRPTLLFYFLLVPAAVAQAYSAPPSINFGWLAWSLAILSHRAALTFCARLDDNRKWWQGSLRLSHAANLWLIAWLFVLELPHWLTKITLPQPFNQLSSIGAYLALSIIMLLVSNQHVRKLNWFRNYQLTYLTWGLTPIAVYLWLRIFDDYGLELTYLSLPNVAQGLVFIVLFTWYLRLNESLKTPFLSSMVLVLVALSSAAWTLQLLLSENIGDYTFSALTLSVSHLFSAYLAKISFASGEGSSQATKSSNRTLLQTIANAALIIGISWLTIIAFVQTNNNYSSQTYALPVLVGLLTLIALGCHFFGKWLKWSTLQGMGLLLVPILIVALVQLPSESLLAGWSTLAWPLAFLVYYWLLKQALSLPAAEKLFQYFAFAHSLSLWLITYLLARVLTEFLQQTLANTNTWSLVSWGSAMAIMAALLISEGFRNLPWLKPYKERLFTLALTPLSILLWFWLMSANINSAVATPLSYIPFLNPLDITQAFSLMVLIWWVRKCRLKFNLFASQKNTLTIALIIASISWPSVVVLRSAHHLLEIPYNFSALYASNIVQSALSIFWTSFALVAMVVAARLKVRLPWLIGAILLALTVTKLFLVDLSQADTLARVISFIAVGVLLLFIGYIAPVPPKANTKESK